MSDSEIYGECVNKNLRFNIKINVFSVETRKWKRVALDDRQNNGWQNHFLWRSGALPRDSKTWQGLSFALRAPCSLHPSGYLRCASSATPVASVGMTQTSAAKRRFCWMQWQPCRAGAKQGSPKDKVAARVSFHARDNRAPLCAGCASGVF